jgi:hypothetical protein
MSLDDSRLCELRSMAAKIAPEIDPYILADPFAMTCPSAARAYAMRGQCSPLEKYLIDTGQWRGPAPIIVFVDQDVTRDEAIQTLLHELGHCLPYRAPEDRVDVVDPADAIEQFNILQEWCSNSEPADPMKPRWVIGDHGRNFTRTVMHLWWRAAMLGEVVAFENLCCGPMYDLAPAYLFWRAIGNEPIRLQHATFSEILTTKPPQAFDDLWYGCLQHWMNNNPEAVKVRAA